MNRLFIAELLRVRGFAVETTQEAGRKQTDDEAQLAYAVSQRRTLLTHNRDDFIAVGLCGRRRRSAGGEKRQNAGQRCCAGAARDDFGRIAHSPRL